MAVDSSAPVAPVGSAAAERPWDPTLGIREDGSIPRRPMPPGLNNPERWRYVPEGKLSQEGVLDRFMLSTFVIPIAFYQEDLGLGMGVNATDIDFLNSRRRQLFNAAATYSTEGQQAYALFWRWYPHHRDVEGGGVVFEERSTLAIGGGYKRTLTQRFFGFGPDTRSRDATTFSSERYALGATFSNAFPEAGDPLIYSLALLGEWRGLGDGRGDFPDTEDIHPVEFAQADEYGILWLVGGLRLDNLDSPANPYAGFALEANVRFAAAQTHSNSGAIFKLGGTWVTRLPSFWHDGGSPDEENPPTDTLAVGAYIESTAGDLPFWALPTLGGPNTLRGYVAGRFTDRVAWHASLEYRFWPIPRGIKFSDSFRIERLGMALFLDTGAVAARLDTLRGDDIRVCGGVSFRLTLERTALFRVDLGYGDEGLHMTVAYGLSF